MESAVWFRILKTAGKNTKLLLNPRQQLWLLESLTLVLLFNKESTEVAVVEAMAAGDATAPPQL